jgi:hypothetical protein
MRASPDQPLIRPFRGHNIPSAGFARKSERPVIGGFLPTGTSAVRALHAGIVAKEGDDRLPDTLAGAYRHEEGECPSWRVVRAQLGEMM